MDFCPDKRKTQGVRIPSPSPRCTALPVTGTGHLGEKKIVFASFPFFLNGRCATIFPCFLMARAYFSSGLFDSVSPCTCSCDQCVHIFF